MSGKRIAYGEARKIPGPFDPHELAQEGLIGLYQGAKRFDPARGLRFSTYARWWARAAMTRAIDSTGYLVRLPAGAIEQRRNVGKQIQEWEQAGVLDWTIPELAAELGFDEGRVRNLLESLEQPLSMDSQVGDDEGGTSRLMGDALADADSPPADDAMISRLDGLWASAAIKSLEPRQATVIRLLFGLDRDGTGRTLSEVGSILGVSKERIRQIRNIALDNLRDTPRRDRRDAEPLIKPLSDLDISLLDAVRAGAHIPSEIGRVVDVDVPPQGKRIRTLRTQLRTLMDRGYLDRRGRRYYLPAAG